jgi:heme/copper-type cytochrome/quinol oxidase subunit 3
MGHVGVGMVVIAVLLVQMLRGKAVAQHIENVGLFWHFVVVVGVVGFWLFKYSA